MTIASFYLGYKEGFIKKVFHIIGFFVGIFLAIKFASNVGELFKSLMGVVDASASIIGGVTIFIFFQIITAIIVKATKVHDKVNHLINKLVGGLIGALQIVIFLSALFFVASKLSFPAEETAKNSFFYSGIKGIFPKIIDTIIPSNEKSKRKKGSVSENIFIVR
jgi:membrane protein required for colicin V production